MERRNALFNWPEFGDRRIIGRFCSLAAGVQFIMGPANHRISSVTTYPFHIFGGLWEENTPPHMDQLPRKGDIVVGNDVWIGREAVILPGVTIGGRRHRRRPVGGLPGRSPLYGGGRKPGSGPEEAV